MLVAAAALLGALSGPLLHTVAVQAGERLPFQPLRLRLPTARREWVTTAATAGLFAAVAAVLGPVPELVAYLWTGAVTVVLTITDLDHKLIPNRVLYPGAAVSAVLLGGGAVISGEVAPFLRALAGGGIYFALLLVVAIAARGGFGFGDVKLAALLGMIAAYLSWRTLAAALVFTGLLGGIPALVLLATRRAKRGDELPYGPAMVAGAWLAVVAGEAILG